MRKQLVPLVGEIRGKKRKRAESQAGNDDTAGARAQPPQRPRNKSFISKETGRLVRTKLTEQQTRVLLDKFEEKKYWKPKECAAMVPGLNQLGPDLDLEQVRRWFDNKRRPPKVKRLGEDGMDGGGDNVNQQSDQQPDSPSTNPNTFKKTKKKDTKGPHKTQKGAVGTKESKILEAAFVQNPAPCIKTRHALATATGMSEKNVTMWFKRRQNGGAGAYGLGNVKYFGLPPGLDQAAHDRMILPNHLNGLHPHSFSAAHLRHQGLLQND